MIFHFGPYSLYVARSALLPESTGQHTKGRLFATRQWLGTNAWAVCPGPVGRHFRAVFRRRTGHEH